MQNRRIKVERTKMIGARVNETERRALIALARLERRTPSETIRELVRQAAHERGVWPVRQAA